MNKKIKILSVTFVALAVWVSFGTSLALAYDVRLHVRDGGTEIFSSDLTLPESGSVTLIDNEGETHDIDSRSVLSLMNQADIASDDFSISDMAYFSSFGSLYIKCIESSAGEHCDNWQYVVNGEYPMSGMDQNILSGGEEIYVYFGAQSRISLSASTITTGDDLILLAESYDYVNDGWNKRSGVDAGLLEPNPDDPWSPIEVRTVETDSNGEAVFSSIPVGTYELGIKEDFYFPTESLNVKAKTSGGGGGNQKAEPETKTEELDKFFDTKKALDFLSEHQEDDGSFGEDIYTDWATMAFASSSLYKEQTMSLIKYISSRESDNDLLTDYQRKAMASMALGLNPYQGTENYIEKIIESFDGKQFGDPNLDNDDIFALIVLNNAGFEAGDEIVDNTLSFLISKQKEDGSFDESVDMTGAGLEALSYFKEQQEVQIAIDKAEEFLDQKQKKDGGWGNVSSTAWAMNGISATAEKKPDWKTVWKKDGNSPADYIGDQQREDGGIEGDNISERIWATAYATVALSGQTWSDIMKNFEKKEISKLTTNDTRLIVLEKKEIKIPTKITQIIKPREETKADEPNIENLGSINTAQAIDALDEAPEPEKKGWFKKMWQGLIGIFF